MDEALSELFIQLPWPKVTSKEGFSAESAMFTKVAHGDVLQKENMQNSKSDKCKTLFFVVFRKISGTLASTLGLEVRNLYLQLVTWISE